MTQLKGVGKESAIRRLLIGAAQCEEPKEA